MSDVTKDVKGAAGDAVEGVKDMAGDATEAGKTVVSNIKDKSQATMSTLTGFGKEQPEDVKLWGVTAVAGVAGALGIAAVTKGVLAVIATVANPFVAVPVGAIGGGALGWSYMKANANGGSK